MAPFPKGVKLYRKFRYRKGHGVHSPFVFNLITKIIEEKSSYYVYEEIEQFRDSIVKRGDRFGDITQKETQHQKYGALLFRLINFFQCQSVLEIGCSTGIIGLYLASARTNCQCTLIDERADLITFIQNYIKNKNIINIQAEPGVDTKNISRILEKTQKVGMVFVNQIMSNNDIESIINICLPYMDYDSLLIIDNIHKSKDRNIVWENLKHNPKVSITLDLYSLGIVFFKKNLYKQHYKTYFNDGKKQNIYKRRRQRFHFFSRRKKGPKNTHPA